MALMSRKRRPQVEVGRINNNNRKVPGKTGLFKIFFFKEKFQPEKSFQPFVFPGFSLKELGGNTNSSRFCQKSTPTKAFVFILCEIPAP